MRGERDIISTRQRPVQNLSEAVNKQFLIQLVFCGIFPRFCIFKGLPKEQYDTILKFQ